VTTQVIDNGGVTTSVTQNGSLVTIRIVANGGTPTPTPTPSVPRFVFNAAANSQYLGAL
jgi:hypothetical protein